MNADGHGSRFFRFSLRTLFMAVTVSCAASAAAIPAVRRFLEWNEERKRAELMHYADDATKIPPLPAIRPDDSPTAQADRP